MGTYKADIRKI